MPERNHPVLEKTSEITYRYKDPSGQVYNFATKGKDPGMDKMKKIVGFGET